MAQEAAQVCGEVLEERLGASLGGFFGRAGDVEGTRGELPSAGFVPFVGS